MSPVANADPNKYVITEKDLIISIVQTLGVTQNDTSFVKSEAGIAYISQVLQSVGKKNNYMEVKHIGVDSKYTDLLKKMVIFNPEKRATIDEVLDQKCFE